MEQNNRGGKPGDPGRRIEQWRIMSTALMLCGFAAVCGACFPTLHARFGNPISLDEDASLAGLESLTQAACANRERVKALAGAGHPDEGQGAA